MGRAGALFQVFLAISKALWYDMRVILFLWRFETMKQPSERPSNGKEFSYLVVWACVVIASAVLFPMVLQSRNVPLVSRIILGAVFVILFVLGIFSISQVFFTST